MEEKTSYAMVYTAWIDDQEMTLCEYADKHGIKNLDPYIIDEIGDVRWPLMLVRGRTITTEQTKILITGEDSVFGEPRDSKGYDCRKYGGSTLGNMFHDYSPYGTWIYSDGTIGGNLTFAKIPFWDEIFPPYMHLAERYPFLDMVISFTTIDQSCCYWCINGDISKRKEEMEKCKCKDCSPHWDKIMKYSDRELNGGENSYFEKCYYTDWDTCHVRSDVDDFVVLTLWIHNGRTDVLFGKDAADKFKEYNTLYCAPEYEFMFTDGLYWDKKVCICNKAFAEECFEYIGKPKSLYDEYVEEGIISPFPETATVVTKEWVVQQYNAFINKRESEDET